MCEREGKRECACVREKERKAESEKDCESKRVENACVNESV